MSPMFSSGTDSPAFSAAFLSTAPPPWSLKLAHIIPSSCRALGRGRGPSSCLGASSFCPPLRKALSLSIRLGSLAGADSPAGSGSWVGSSIQPILTDSRPSRVRVFTRVPSSSSWAA